MNGDWQSTSFLLAHRRHRFDALHDLLTGQGLNRPAGRLARHEHGVAAERATHLQTPNEPHDPRTDT
ncbi:MAG: hypothetical protein VX874_14630 [Pseudomonadota bacterium]|nr:hypothetical protein [Pseudomonadota bacterium]